MPTSLYRFSEVRAKTAKPKDIKQSIVDVLRADDDKCYINMERYLMPPGISGSRAFDQAYAVEVLLKHDKDNGSHIAKTMEETPSLTHRALFDFLVRVLRDAGFRISHGRLTGLLEGPQKPESDEPGQPDID